MRRLRSVWAVMCVAGVASPWPIAGAEFAPGGTGSSATAPPRAGAVDVGAPGAARRRLFSDPAQAMPDVYMSESVVELDEGKSATYTVQLTHAPGMREDGTIDLDNDEVRVYLTSSQSVLQQDDNGGKITFEERRNHRTQLQILTNDVNGDGSPEIPTGPRPYIYKTFSTVGGNVATQQSPVVERDGQLWNDVVCPVCLHPAYCQLMDGKQYGGGGAKIIDGSVQGNFSGCYQVNLTFAPVLDLCAANQTAVVSENNPLVGKCSRPVHNYSVYDGVQPKPAGGGHASVPGWSYNSPVPLVDTVAGNSDFRIDVVGNQVLRTRTDPAPLCRFSNCPELVVNGGDQHPESRNFLQPDWSCEIPKSGPHVAKQCGSTWHGDLSSSAQLAFDSTNWEVPQTVRVNARDDDVFEPQVGRRGQPAYVHHFVVAQDINLEHSYYDDIEVNDFVVMVNDNDPAVVIENRYQADPVEGGQNSQIKLRLSSEPMYPVTVYLQSGPFFTPGEYPFCGEDKGTGKFRCNIEPDDEQVIFQDQDQFDTCFKVDSFGRELTATEGRIPPSFVGAGQIGNYPTRGCFNGTVQQPERWDRQNLFDAASQSQFLNHTSSREVLQVGTCVSTPCTDVNAVRACRNDGHFITIRFYNKDGLASVLPNSGFSCNSYVTFSTTNWNTWKALAVVGVDDDTDEGASRLSQIGMLYESIDWYYNSAGARLIATSNPEYRPYVDAARANFTVDLGMFDTRFGRHINRYPTLSSDDDFNKLPSIWYGSDMVKNVTTADRVQAHHVVDAGNKVCCCELDQGESGAINAGGAEDPAQVVTFNPDNYKTLGIKCHAQTMVTDNDQRGVTISRSTCEATEGRRFWFDRFKGEMTPSSCHSNGTLVGPNGGPPMPITLGLFTDRYVDADVAVALIADQLPNETHVIPMTGSIEGNLSDNVAVSDNSAFDRLYWDQSGSNVSCSSLNGDGWTMVDYADPNVRGMTAPVCPYTIVLDRAPYEGTTVVIHVREDLKMSTYRDHELFFYEEPSYRNEVSESECVEEQYPGSDWRNGGCFIYNVPLDVNNVPVPRGSTDLDVMFTDKDWNVPRRITVVALNDDVDEPTEIRTIHHTVGSCIGFNHNNNQPCKKDPYYSGMAVSHIDVVVVDDDIADLVVICADGYDSMDGRPVPINEDFIGAYDAAGPMTTAWANWNESDPDFALYAHAAENGSNWKAKYDQCLEVEIDKNGTNATADADKCTSVTSRDGAPCEYIAGVLPADEKCECSDGRAFSGRDACELANCTFSPRVTWAHAVCRTPQPTGINLWYENFERSGPDAEDGISGSGYQSRSIGHAGAQILNDGIGGGGYQQRSGNVGDGYITDPKNPECIGDKPTQKSGGSNKCFRIDNQPWLHYDPYWDRYTAYGYSYDKDAASKRNTYDACTPVGQPCQHRDPAEFRKCIPGVDMYAITPQPNRGFKGIGPANTEPENAYACTVHTRECSHDVIGDSCAHWGEKGFDKLTDTKPGGWVQGKPEDKGYGEGTADGNSECFYGSFKVRLNSSPGTKHVQRQYLGEPVMQLDEELVQVVVTPDATPQTRFDPSSVTFTHTGGKLPSGEDTYRWDEPATIKVVPVDDLVDERAGVIIDFTSFSITQSHFGDAYWSYTNPYQTHEDPGNQYTPLTMDALEAINETTRVGGHGGYACEDFSDPDRTCTGRNDFHTPFRHHLRTIHTKDNDYSGVTLESGMSTSGTTIQSPTANVNFHTHDPIIIDVVEGGSFGYYTLQLDTQPRKPQRQAGTNPNDPVHTGVVYNEGGTHTCGLEDYSDVTRPHMCGSVESEETYWVDVTVTQSMYIDLAKPKSCPIDAPWGGGETPERGKSLGQKTFRAHDRFPYNSIEGSPINELVFNKWDMSAYLATCGGWQRDATYRFTSENWNQPQYVYFYAHNDKTAGGDTTDKTTGLRYTSTTLHHYVETEDTLDNMVRLDNRSSSAIEGFVQRNKHGGIYTFGNPDRFPFGQRSQGSSGQRVTGFTTYGYTNYPWVYGYVMAAYTRTGLHIAGAPCGSPHMGADIPPAGNIWTYAGEQLPTNNGAKGLNKGGYINPKTLTRCLTRDGREVPYDLDGTHCLPLANPCSSFPCADAVVCVPRFATLAGGLHFPPKSVAVKVFDNDVLAIQKEVWPCRQTSLFKFPDTDFEKTGQYHDEWMVDYNCKNGDAGGLPGFPIEFANGDANVPGDRQCIDNRAGPYCETCASGYILEKGLCRQMTKEEAAKAGVKQDEEEEEESGR